MPGSKKSLCGSLLTRLYNVRRVDNDLYRSPQFYGNHLARVIDQLGIRSLINLRGDDPDKNWYRNELRICREKGVERTSVGLNSKWIPRQFELIELLETFATAPRPMLMKCSGGADRTSFASALYLLDRAYRNEAAPDLHKVLREARDQMKLFPYLHLPKQHQRWLPVFFEFFRDDHGDKTPLQWLQDDYRWERFARYMTDRGLAGWWAGPQLPRDEGRVTRDEG